ncbi:MAG TPA: hypothetical protein VN934_03595 [Candidatus Tumulicola sp.]|nr:hypothetical protein [Candidatus Tumulicola sp.]
MLDQAVHERGLYAGGELLRIHCAMGGEADPNGGVARARDAICVSLPVLKAINERLLASAPAREVVRQFGLHLEAALWTDELRADDPTSMKWVMGTAAFHRARLAR